MKKTFYLFTFLLFYLLLAACDNTIYNQFASTADGIWEKNEEAILTTSPMRYDATVDEELLLRLEKGAYPFSDICVIVEQTIYPSDATSIDTVVFDLTGGKGRMSDSGISLVEHNLPFKRFALHKGDSIVTVIRHNMTEKSLLGIRDIGIRMEEIKN